MDLATGEDGSGGASGDPRTSLQQSIHRPPLLRPPRFPAFPRPSLRRNTRGRGATTAGAQIRADGKSATTSRRPNRRSPPAEQHCRRDGAVSTAKPHATPPAMPLREGSLLWPTISRIHDEPEMHRSQKTLTRCCRKIQPRRLLRERWSRGHSTRHQPGPHPLADRPPARPFRYLSGPCPSRCL